MLSRQRELVKHQSEVAGQIFLHGQPELRKEMVHQPRLMNLRALGASKATIAFMRQY